MFCSCCTATRNSIPGPPINSSTLFDGCSFLSRSASDCPVITTKGLIGFDGCLSAPGDWATERIETEIRQKRLANKCLTVMLIDTLQFTDGLETTTPKAFGFSPGFALKTWDKHRIVLYRSSCDDCDLIARTNPFRVRKFIRNRCPRVSKQTLGWNSVSYTHL